jgi:hypothetical protein
VVGVEEVVCAVEDSPKGDELEDWKESIPKRMSGSHF